MESQHLADDSRYCHLLTLPGARILFSLECSLSESIALKDGEFAAASGMSEAS